MTPLNSYLEIIPDISDDRENLEAPGQYRVLLFKDWLYKPYWRISRGGGGGGGGGVMVFTDEGYFLFLPGSRVIFAVILFLTSKKIKIC